MKIARLPTKKRKLWIYLVLIIGIPILTYAAYQAVQIISNASADTQPRNLLLSNLTTSSVTVSWTTDSSVRGTVSLVTNGAEGSPILDSRGNGSRYTHYVEITGLDPNTKYSFLITSNSTKYTSTSGVNFSFKTAPVTTTAATPNPIYGTVSNYSGDDIVLFASMKDKSVYPVSATMPSGGNWIMDLSIFRKISDNSLVVTNNDSSLVLIAMTGSGKGAEVEGKYSELFDSNGKLLATKTLSITESSSLVSYFPDIAQLKAVESSDNSSTNGGTDNENNSGSDSENNSGNGGQTDSGTDTTSGERVFRIVKDLNWVNMVDTSINNWPYGESTVQITNLSDTEFTVVWISQKSESGYIKYGTSASSLSSQALDDRDSSTSKGNYYVHSVTVSKLQPELKYYFEVVSGTSTYDNSGKKYSLSTLETLSSAPAYVSISGKVSDMPESGEAVLIAYIKDIDGSGSTGSSKVVSSVVDEDGKWILSISNMRTADGTAYFEYTNKDKLYFTVLTTAPKQTEASTLIDGITTSDVEFTINYDSVSTDVKRLTSYGVI